MRFVTDCTCPSGSVRSGRRIFWQPTKKNLPAAVSTRTQAQPLPSDLPISYPNLQKQRTLRVRQDDRRSERAVGASEESEDLQADALRSTQDTLDELVHLIHSGQNEYRIANATSHEEHRHTFRDTGPLTKRLLGGGFRLPPITDDIGWGATSADRYERSTQSWAQAADSVPMEWLLA